MHGWLAAATASVIPHNQPINPTNLLPLHTRTPQSLRYARIWRIGQGTSTLGAAGGGGSPAGTNSTTTAATTSSSTLADLITRYAPRPHIAAAGHTYWCSLEALLVGHEDWVHSVCWQKAAGPGPKAGSPPSTAAPAHAPRRAALCLLSASQDRSMLLWRCDEASGLWLSEASVGDAGATCLGYFGGVFGPDGRRILAHGFTGALHLWDMRPCLSAGEAGSADAAADAAAGAGLSSWLPRHACGGHFGAVVDLCWGAGGRCLQSVSTDQTARLFTDVGGQWCELARTQVHGHDFSCLASIPVAHDLQPSSSGAGSSSGGSSYLYVSGSEEKILRVFEAPVAFLDSLDLARGAPPGASSSALGVARRGAALALGAAVGALALSNKAVYVEPAAAAGGGDGSGDAAGGATVGDYPEGPDMLPRATPGVVRGPPLEEHLAQNTLWPEVRKLYGHGNDVYCVAASPCGRMLASACRAQAAGAAEVWVWEVGTWRALARLPAHGLTVTQLAFSPSGRLLLSGSRDRSVAVWRVGGGGGSEAAAAGGGSEAAAGGAGGAGAAAAGAPSFDLLARLKAAHSRIIWGVSWSHDERVFASCSRDHTVKLWSVGAAGPSAKPCCTLPPFPCPVTAVALAPAHVTGGGGGSTYLCAVGLEDGGLQLWSAETDPEAGPAASRLLWAAARGEGHAAAVRRVAWSPSRAGGGAPLLASCGEDHAVRVYEVVV
jgi:elongator complex protein 2